MSVGIMPFKRRNEQCVADDESDIDSDGFRNSDFASYEISKGSYKKSGARSDWYWSPDWKAKYKTKNDKNIENWRTIRDYYVQYGFSFDTGEMDTEFSV